MEIGRHQIIFAVSRRYKIMDVLTPEQRRRCMQANKSRGTKPELALGRLLWGCGIRYRKHPSDVPGRPDFCVKKYRMAIFVDGEFWHGRNWEAQKARLKSNREFWIAKIERNMARDARVNRELEESGWKGFRFWESDIKKHPGACVGAVVLYLSYFHRFEVPEYIPADYQEYDDGQDAGLNAMAAEPAEAYGRSMDAGSER